LNLRVIRARRMTCAHLGQCGGAGFDLLVLSLRMKQNIAPGIALTRQMRWCQPHVDQVD
jgi:hypothetical protein